MKSALSVDALPGISNHNIIFLKCDFTVTRAREPVKELFELNNAEDQSILDCLFWRLFAKNIGVNELHFKSAARMHEASSEYSSTEPMDYSENRSYSIDFSLKRPRVTPSKSCKYLFFNVTMRSILKSNLRKFSMYTTLLTRLSYVQVTNAPHIAEACNTFFHRYFGVIAPRKLMLTACVGFELPDLVISEEGIFSSLLNRDPKKICRSGRHT